MTLLGKQVKDKVTGFEGIAVTQLISLFGCNQYGVTPPVGSKENMKRGDTEYFDEGRLVVIGPGLTAEEVAADKPGCDFNPEAPR